METFIIDEDVLIQALTYVCLSGIKIERVEPNQHSKSLEGKISETVAESIKKLSPLKRKKIIKPK